MAVQFCQNFDQILLLIVFATVANFLQKILVCCLFCPKKKTSVAYYCCLLQIMRVVPRRSDRSFEWSGLTCVGLFDSYQLRGRWFFVQLFKSVTFWPFFGLFWFTETTQKHGFVQCWSSNVIFRLTQSSDSFLFVVSLRSLLSSKLLFTKVFVK